MQHAAIPQLQHSAGWKLISAITRSSGIPYSRCNTRSAQPQSRLEPGDPVRGPFELNLFLMRRMGA